MLIIEHDNEMILVVFQEIPDNTFFSIFKDTPENNKRLRSYHGQYINAEGILKGMTDFFYDNNGVYKYKKHTDPIEWATFNLIICCGIIL